MLVIYNRLSVDIRLSEELEMQLCILQIQMA